MSSLITAAGSRLSVCPPTAFLLLALALVEPRRLGPGATHQLPVTLPLFETLFIVPQESPVG